MKGRKDTVKFTNEIYERNGIALIQQIATPTTVIRKGNQIVGAFHKEQSTLDFRGTLAGGQSISFDCKESTDERGLPLSYIKPHQIEYMSKALRFDEITFLVVYIKPLNKYYRASYEVISALWRLWQENKGKRGFNYMPVENMKEITQGRSTPLDYLAGITNES